MPPVRASIKNSHRGTLAKNRRTTVAAAKAKEKIGPPKAYGGPYRSKFKSFQPAEFAVAFGFVEAASNFRRAGFGWSLNEQAVMAVPFAKDAQGESLAEGARDSQGDAASTTARKQKLPTERRTQTARATVASTTATANSDGTRLRQGFGATSPPLQKRFGEIGPSLQELWRGESGNARLRRNW